MVDSARMQSLVFQYPSTYSNDYQLPPISKKYITVEKEKKKSTEKKRVRPMNDTHTLAELKTAVPFDLMIKRKDIIGTHPMTLQKKVDDLYIDTGLEEAIRTRPRLIMAPAGAIDNLLDKRARDILIAETYTSCTAQMTRHAGKSYLSVAPLVGHPAPANPITLPSLKLPLVPSEWKMDSITWDGKQLRIIY